MLITWYNRDQVLYSLTTFNPFQNNPLFLRPLGPGLLKTLWEKEKMLVTSIFSFFHNVFYHTKKEKSQFWYIWLILCRLFRFCLVPNFVVWERVEIVHSLILRFLQILIGLTEWCSQSIVVLLNPFPHNDTFWRPWKTSLSKTMWEKEKLLVTSNLSFSHSVFYPFG